MESSGSITRNTFVVISVALILVLVVMLRRVYELKISMLELQREVAKSQIAIATQMSNVKKTSAITATTNRQTIQTIRAELENAKQQLRESSGEAKTVALGDVRRLEKELRSEKLKQQDLQDQLNHQMSDVRLVVGKADEKLGGVSSEVSSIKSEVAETKSDLRKALFDYKRMTGDMGVMSGLIATNTKELDTLRALGDRRYTEFAIQRAKAPMAVDSVSILLRKTDPTRHRFSIDVYADDVTVQKKDKTVNEPLQFYVRNIKQPFEIVVNEVRKGEITGYLAAPKTENAVR